MKVFVQIVGALVHGLSLVFGKLLAGGTPAQVNSHAPCLSLMWILGYGVGPQQGFDISG